MLRRKDLVPLSHPDYRGLYLDAKQTCIPSYEEDTIGEVVFLEEADFQQIEKPVHKEKPKQIKKEKMKHNQVEEQQEDQEEIEKIMQQELEKQIEQERDKLIEEEIRQARQKIERLERQRTKHQEREIRAPPPMAFHPHNFIGGSSLCTTSDPMKVFTEGGKKFVTLSGLKDSAAAKKKKQV